METQIKIKEELKKVLFKMKLIKTIKISLLVYSLLCIFYMAIQSGHILLLFGASIALSTTIEHIRNIWFDYQVISKEDMIKMINNIANTSMNIINTFTKKTIQDLQIDNIKDIRSKSIN